MQPDLAVCATWEGWERQMLHLLEASADMSPDILPLHSLSVGGEVPVVWHRLCGAHGLRTMTAQSYAEVKCTCGTPCKVSIPKGAQFCSVWVRSNEYSKYSVRTDIIKMPLWPHLFWL